MAKKLQVFISSTFKDLKAERQAAVEAVLKAGHIPAGMELFTAGDESQLETICRWIENSDVYMLILGGRYGSIEPKSNISYTEFEYNYATSKNIPSFSVVINESELNRRLEKDSVTFGEQEFPDKLNKFREKVLSRISTFFDEPKDIKLAIHESLMNFLHRHEITGWVRGNELIDPEPLYKELKLYKENNNKLLEELEINRKEINEIRSRKVDKIELSFDEIHKVLSKVIVKTNVFNTEFVVKEYSLLNLLLFHRDIFVSGYRENYPMSTLDQFVNYSICTKLVVYGLLARETIKISDYFTYNQYLTTQKGIEFLSFVDKFTYLD